MSILCANLWHLLVTEEHVAFFLVGSKWGGWGVPHFSCTFEDGMSLRSVGAHTWKYVVSHRWRLQPEHRTPWKLTGILLPEEPSSLRVNNKIRHIALSVKMCQFWKELLA
jgi:hypothetical protein